MAPTGNTIRTMRQAQGLSLRDLARLSDTTHGYLSLVERGHREPSVRWLAAVKGALADNMTERAS